MALQTASQNSLALYSVIYDAVKTAADLAKQPGKEELAKELINEIWSQAKRDSVRHDNMVPALAPFYGCRKNPPTPEAVVAAVDASVPKLVIWGTPKNGTRSTILGL